MIVLQHSFLCEKFFIGIIMKQMYIFFSAKVGIFSQSYAVMLYCFSTFYFLDLIFNTLVI